MPIDKARVSKVLHDSSFFFGFAFWQAWWMVFMRRDDLLVSNTSIDGGLPATLLVGLFTTVGYLVIGLIFRTNRKPQISGHVLGITAILASASSMGIYITRACGSGAFAVSLSYVSLLCFSAGNALLLALWGNFWSKLTFGQVTKSLFSSYLLSFALYFFIRYLPVLFCGIAVSLFPIASVLFLKGDVAQQRTNISYEYDMSEKTFFYKALFFVGILSFT